MQDKLLIIFSLCILLQLSGCEKKINDLIYFPPLGECHIDIPTNNSRISSSQKINIGGWAFHKDSREIPDTATLYFINKDNELKSINLYRNSKRPDVANLFNNEKLIDSGFNGEIPPNFLTSGNYELIIIQSSRYSEPVRCGGQQKYNIEIY